MSGPDSQKPFVLVTGASGFLGAHVVVQLLDAGYRVRCTARGLKARLLETAYSDRGKQFAVVEVEDLARGDLSDALEDIEAVIHVAFPAPGSMDSEELLLNGVNSTTNLLRQAYDCGIHKFVITGSYLAVVGADPDSVWREYTFTDQDWSAATYNDVFDGSRDPSWVYAAAKKLAEAAAWDFARTRPQIDLSTVIPTLLLGPFAPGHAVLSMADLSTNILLHALTSPTEPPPRPVWPHFVDVRDAARAHLLALEKSPLPHPPPQHPAPTTSPPSPEVRTPSFSDPSFRARRVSWLPSSTRAPRKRFLVSGASFTWAAALAHLCPERTPQPEVALPEHVAGLDVRWTGGEGLNLTWHDWRETLDDAVHDLERVAAGLERSGWEELFGNEEPEEVDVE